MNKRQEEFFFYSSFIVHRSSFRREEQGEMSFAILGMGTAVPAATLTQEEALGLALEQARLRAGQVTHLVTVSCTGFAAPGVDLALIRGLGLPPTVQRTHVGFMGCHGAINGLRVVTAFGGADANAVVLLC